MDQLFQVQAMAKEKPDLKAEIEDKAPEKTEPTPPPAVVPTTGPFTRCFTITHPLRANRVFADSPDEALQILCDQVYPDVTPEGLKKAVTIRECKFRPAATEADKPCGWPRSKHGKITV